MLFGRHVNRYYLRYIHFFLLGLIALIVVDWFQLEIPRICGEILDGLSDTVKDNPDSLFHHPEQMKQLMLYLGIIACIMFGGRFLWRYSILGVAARIESDMRLDLFSHSLKLSNSYYKKHKTGALMTLYTNDLQVIRQAFGSGTVMLVDIVFLGGFALYKMFRCNWVLSCFSLIPMALIATASGFLGRVLKEKFKQRQEAYEELSDFTQENFSGIAVIKAFVKEIHEIRHFAKINEKNRLKNINYVKYSVLLNVLLTVTISIIFIILFAGGTYFVINGFNGKEFTTGKMWEFIGYFDAAIWPFMAVAQLINMRSQAKASLTRINDFLDSPIEVKDEEVTALDHIAGKIEFKNLTFSYPDSTIEVLKNINLTISAGTMVGIIGKTGCGKTTMVDLLLRTYNLSEQTLLIDDQDIMHLPIKQVRDNIGYVPQDNFLFSDTLANNIAFAFDSVDEQRIEEAAKLSDVHSNIMGFQDQYQTILGERGVTLSGGQKQRVSIARALIKDPAILIFDDSVSAVDTKTEEAILNNLRNIRKGKTTIMIAHRISTVQSLDLIVVLEEGQIVGLGTHEELLNTCPYYQEMVRLQSLEDDMNQ